MSDKLDNDAAVDRALGAIGGAGAAGEVFLREGWSTAVEVREGAAENVISRGERGIGVRLLREGRAGFAYTSDLTRDGIAACVDAARDMSVVTAPDPHLRLADIPLAPVDLGLVDRDEERSVAERTELAFAVERAARAADARITAFRKTTYSDGVTTTMLANTGGVRGSYHATYYSVGTSAVATDGEERQIGSHSQASRRFTDLDAEATGRRAAELAAAKLGARTFPTQRLPVVLDPFMGMALLGAIAPLFSADSVLKGKSLFASKIGEQVASEQVTIVDDARAPGGLRSSPFDGEGVATTTRTLLERGVLRGYLSSLKTASRMGIAPTGNARRGSYAQPGRIGVAELPDRGRRCGPRGDGRRTGPCAPDHLAAQPSHRRSDLRRVLPRRDRRLPRARDARLSGAGHHDRRQPHDAARLGERHRPRPHRRRVGDREPDAPHLRAVDRGDVMAA